MVGDPKEQIASGYGMILVYLGGFRTGDSGTRPGPCFSVKKGRVA